MRNQDLTTESNHHWQFYIFGFQSTNQLVSKKHTIIANGMLFGHKFNDKKDYIQHQCGLKRNSKENVHITSNLRSSSSEVAPSILNYQGQYTCKYERSK